MKENELNFITDDYIRNMWKKILDQAYRAVRQYQTTSTSFLTPAEWSYSSEILRLVPNLHWILDGGHEHTERKRLYMRHEDLAGVPQDSCIDILSIRSTSKFRSLTHRDYLGSILSLGLKREKLGDVIVSDHEAVVFVAREVSEFIRLHLNKIANCSVEISQIRPENVLIEEPEYKLVKGTVASLRADSVIALAYAISRANAQTMLKQDKVKINWKQNSKTNYEVKINDTISVSGKGRAVVLDIGKVTKSNRRHVLIGRKS